MTYGITMKDLCQRLNPQNLRINERRLVQFGLIEGLIRRVYNVSSLHTYICVQWYEFILFYSILYFFLVHLAAKKRETIQSISILQARIASMKYVVARVNQPRKSKILLNAIQTY